MGLIAKGKVKPPTDKDYMVVASYTDVQEILKPQPKMQANLVNVGALKKYVAATPKYKVYSALLKQSGTSDPTAVVNENTIGVFTLTRNSTGVYYLTSPGFNGFPDYGKVLVFLTNGFINRSITGAYTPPINGVVITTADLAGIFTDGYINNCSIEIRVYN